MSPCASAVPWETLVAYWANDLGEAEAERVEAHLMGCDACSRESERVARLAQAFREAIPVVISRDRVEALRAEGLAIEENVFAPGRRQEVTFHGGVDLLVHRLGGLDLSAAKRVDVEVRSESTGALLAQELDAPFDATRGEVLVACQRHFAVMPPDVLFAVRVHDGAGKRTEAFFAVPHVYG